MKAAWLAAWAERQAHDIEVVTKRLIGDANSINQAIQAIRET